MITISNHAAWRLTWLPGQATDRHDHGGAAGALLVLAGQLTELDRRSSARLSFADSDDAQGPTTGTGRREQS